jgi:hypothetical protein
VKNLKEIAVKTAEIGSLALLLATSAFADSRHQDGTWRDNDRGRDRGQSQSSGQHRENDRVTMQGHIQSFTHERGGYRVRLDRGYDSYWVPESYFRSRARDLRVGVSISLGGIFRDGSIYVDAVDWPDGGYGGGYNDGYGYRDGYNNGFVAGVVDRIDYRRGTLLLRDDRSGRVIEVDMRSDRYGRLNIDDLRRGDYVELSGDWVRGNIFAARRVESVRNGRRY